MNKNWYAVYTKTQSEKKVAALLSRKKIENFCPLNRLTNNQGNRRKLSYEPLFPSFVFVNITEEEMPAVRQTGDVLNFVYWLGKPAVIKPVEVDNIAHFSSTYYDIQLEKTSVSSNGIVRITHEPHLDMSGGAASVKINRIKVSLPSLGFAMTAETEKINLAEFGIVSSKLLV